MIEEGLAQGFPASAPLQPKFGWGARSFQRIVVVPTVFSRKYKSFAVRRMKTNYEGFLSLFLNSNLGTRARNVSILKFQFAFSFCDFERNSLGVIPVCF